jgi:hypothetical protein
MTYKEERQNSRCPFMRDKKVYLNFCVWGFEHVDPKQGFRNSDAAKSLHRVAKDAIREATCLGNCWSAEGH